MSSRHCLATEVLGITPEECAGPDPDISELAGQAACAGCLMPSLKVLKAQVRKAEAVAARNAQLERMAETDELTKQLNRRGFENQLAHLMKQGKSFGLIMLDLIKFGVVNQREGHLGGDLILKDAADYLTEAVRETDTVVCRFGGDEFAIFLSLQRRHDDGIMTAEDVEKVTNRLVETYAGRPEVLEYNARYEANHLGMKAGSGIWVPGISREDFITTIDPKGKNPVSE